jgi:hypothetical protein
MLGLEVDGVETPEDRIMNIAHVTRALGPHVGLSRSAEKQETGVQMCCTFWLRYIGVGIMARGLSAQIWGAREGETAIIGN